MSKTTPESAAWDAYWKDRKGEDVKALTGIEHDRELAAFWTSALENQDKNAPFLDMACGAGTVLKTAHGLGFTDLHGADVAPAAITALSQTLPSVKGTVCPATATPFEDGAFATITSQFGFEYAGADAAAKEIARLLAPGGRFAAIVHMAGGAIHDEVAGHVDHCKTIAESGYVEKARALFRSVYSGNVEAMNNSIAYMADAREKVFGLVVPGRPSLAAHLTAGTAELWDKRDTHALEDILAWLTAMDGQRIAFQLRMQAMLDAALSQEQVEGVVATLSAEGLVADAPTTFELGGEPAAWVLKATRAA